MSTLTVSTLNIFHANTNSNILNAYFYSRSDYFFHHLYRDTVIWLFTVAHDSKIISKTFKNSET